jgi:glycerophosphoryl diester phosphodiesterase
MPFNGYTEEKYARDMLNTFIKRGIAPNRVWAQSFNPPNIFQWVKEYPEFAKQAVYLDEDGDTAATLITATARLGALKTKGVNIISPPFAYLLTTTTADNKTIIPSAYPIEAKKVGLDIIPWTFKRSGPLTNVAADGEYYYAKCFGLEYGNKCEN